MVCESAGAVKTFQPLMAWIDEVSQSVATGLMDQMTPAVRQALMTLEAMEAGVQAVMTAIGQAVVQRLIEATPVRAIGRCGECGSRLRLVDARRPRIQTGIFGDYTIARAYYVCPAGHGTEVPLDRQLRLGSHQATPLLSRLITRYAIEVPFDQVADLLAETTGRSLDGEVIRRIVEDVGTYAEQLEQAAIASAADTVRLPAVPGGSTLIVAVDGAMVNTRRAGEQGWHEAKVGVCVRGEPQIACATDTGEPVWQSQTTDYCAGFEDREQFWPRVYAHALAMGLEDPSCQQVVLMGDGAHWIWDHGPVHLRPPGKTWVETLDFYHATEHLWTVAHAVWPDDLQAATVWVNQAAHGLKHAGFPGLADVWHTLPPGPAAARDVVDREARYFSYHASRMDYPTYIQMGLPIGSGMVESGCKTIVKERESGSGMRWQETGAQAMATLRALHRSGRWETFWYHNPCCQLVPPRRRIAA